MMQASRSRHKKTRGKVKGFPLKQDHFQSDMRQVDVIKEAGGWAEARQRVFCIGGGLEMSVWLGKPQANIDPSGVAVQSIR